MPNYKVLFVGEQKVKGVPWRSREDAARRIVEQGLSVVNIYERATGRHFFDVSAKIANLINATYGKNIAENVLAFIVRAGK